MIELLKIDSSDYLTDKKETLSRVKKALKFFDAITGEVDVRKSYRYDLSIQSLTDELKYDGMDLLQNSDGVFKYKDKEIIKINFINDEGIFFYTIETGKNTVILKYNIRHVLFLSDNEKLNLLDLLEHTLKLDTSSEIMMQIKLMLVIGK